jgi:hypothetical protein
MPVVRAIVWSQSEVRLLLYSPASKPLALMLTELGQREVSANASDSASSDAGRDCRSVRASFF